MGRGRVGAALLAAALLQAGCGAPGASERYAGRPPGRGEATVYFVLLEPQPGGRRFVIAEGTLLTPRTIEVDSTGDPAVDALHALMSREAPEPWLNSSPVADLRDPEGRSRFDVASVEHRDGLVTVDFTADFYDPCPACDIFLASDPGSIVQQYVLTAQAALDTDDPVLFTAQGEPVRGLYLERVRGPVAADPALVVPPGTDASPVAAAGMATPDRRPSPSMAAQVSGVVRRDEDGCVGLDPGAGVQPTVWPFGWTAWVTPGGMVLLDDRGRLVAREGDRLTGAGGFVPAAVDSPCLPGDDADVVHLQTSVALVARGG